MSDPLILVFLKFPEPGRVKTRLAQSVGSETAAIVYRRLVRETLELAHAAPGDVRILYDPPGRQQDVIDWIGSIWPGDVDLLGFQPQATGDLGARLKAGFKSAFETGHEKVCAIGTDCVEITPELYAETWEKLDSDADAVFGPTDDGGYYLVGLKKLDERVFDVPWSAPDTLEKSLERATECGFKIHQLPGLTDIDTIDEWSYRKAHVIGQVDQLDEPLVFQRIHRDSDWGPVIELADRADAQSVVSEGAFSGFSLSDLWKYQRAEIFGSDQDAEQFPLQIRFINIQRESPVKVDRGSGGKLWYFAGATGGATLHVGLKGEVSPEQLKEDGTRAMHQLHPITDEFVYIPSGCPHAVGAGLTIFEIQENGGADPLVGDSLIDAELNYETPSLGDAMVGKLAQSDAFAVDRLQLQAEDLHEIGGRGQFVLVTVIDGMVECGGQFFQTGDLFAIPASGALNCDLRTHAQPATILRISMTINQPKVVTEPSTELATPTQKEQSFYRSMRKRLHDWADSKAGEDNKWIEFLLLAPDMFHLMCCLVADPDVPTKYKAKLGAAIAYFISPIDLLPEGILGPIGYLDDLLVSAWVINELVNSLDPKIIERHWAGEDDVLETTQQLMAKADEMVGSGLWKRVREQIDRS
ncbi:MAG: TIGR04282 family arsenosugar biosynthesis glycosyltransferase [Verrucomicrobiota bacterium]